MHGIRFRSKLLIAREKKPLVPRVECWKRPSHYFMYSDYKLMTKTHKRNSGLTRKLLSLLNKRSHGTKTPCWCTNDPVKQEKQRENTSPKMLIFLLFNYYKILLCDNSDNQMQHNLFIVISQRAKKVVSDSPGLVDFAIRLVIFVLNLPDGQVLFFGRFKLLKDCHQSC